MATKVGKPALRGKGPEILEALGATSLEDILNNYGPQEQAEIRQTLLKLDFKTYEATALLAALANEKDSIRLSLKHAATVPKKGGRKPHKRKQVAPLAPPARGLAGPGAKAATDPKKRAGRDTREKTIIRVEKQQQQRPMKKRRQKKRPHRTGQLRHSPRRQQRTSTLTVRESTCA